MRAFPHQAEIAFHESAHAVTSWFLGGDVERLTIEPGADEQQTFMGYCQHSLARVPPHHRGDTCAIVGLAGAAAHRIFHPERDPSANCRGDVAQVDQLIAHGLTTLNREALMRMTEQLVAEQWPLIDRLALVLLERGTLGHAEVEAILGAS